MTRVLSAALTAALAFTGLATAQVPDVDIPYESFQLENEDPD